MVVVKGTVAKTMCHVYLRIESSQSNYSSPRFTSRSMPKSSNSYHICIAEPEYTFSYSPLLFQSLNFQPHILTAQTSSLAYSPTNLREAIQKDRKPCTVHAARRQS